MIGKHPPPQPASAPGKAGAPAQFGALLMTDGGAQRSGPPYSVQRTDGNRNRACAGLGKAQGALPRRAAVQPGQSARRHLPDRERAHQGVLHRAVGPRDHAGLLALRQFRRRPGSLQAGPARLVGRCGRQQHGAAFAGRRAAPDGDDDSGARHRNHRGPQLQGPMLFGAGANARDALADRAARATPAASDEFVRRRRASMAP